MTLSIVERRLARVIDSLFTHMGVPATYHRWGVDHRPVTVILKSVDPFVELNERPIAVASQRLDVRVTEVDTPQLGHHFTLGDQVYRIEDEPVKEAHARVWSMTILPVAANTLNHPGL